jgi:hypothetical protein
MQQPRQQHHRLKDSRCRVLNRRSNLHSQRTATEDGWLDIDNNEGENSLRDLCLGRKNWLFLGSDRGGRAAAIHFSLLASCKRHGHDPWAYYRDIAGHASRGKRRRSSRPPSPPLASRLTSHAPRRHAPLIATPRVPPDAYE